MRNILLLAIALCVGLPARAEVRLILSPAKSHPKVAAKIEMILKRPEVLRHEPVFSAVEAERLRKMGAKHLAEARLVFVENLEAERALLKAVKAAGPGLRLDPGKLEMWVAGEPFEDEQWALHNTQPRQSVELDFMNSHWVPARAGEDVGLDRAAPLLAKLPIKKKVRVAVLDTGLDPLHPDLREKLHRREPECRALEKFQACLAEKERAACEAIWFDFNNPEVDQDKNGYPLDCQGWTLLGGLNKAGIMGRPDYEDTEGHGTHVAGIIAAGAANGTGIRGCSDNIELIPVQVLGRNPGEPIKPLSTEPPKEVDLNPKEGNRKKPQELSDIVARGVIYAIHSGADVINFSMGWPAAQDSEFMRDVIQEAQRRGILIVAAAGNDSTKALIMPCGYPGVLCVGAHGPDGALSHFSNYGSGVDLAAPGLNILSTWPMAKRPVRFRASSGYEFMHGTSQAAPIVSCLAGELLARGMGPEEAYSRLVLGARPHRTALELEEGSPHTLPPESNPREAREAYAKYTLAGNADIARALEVRPQSVIVPVEKQKGLIKWDLASRELRFPFRLKNLWRDANDVRLDVKLAGEEAGAIRPALTGIEGSLAAPWKAGTEREFTAVLRINDAEDPSKTRIPSDLELEVSVFLGNRPQLKFRVPGEVIVELSPDLPGVKSIPVGRLPRVRYSLVPVDLNLDRNQDFHDYLLADYGNTHWTYYLLAQDRAKGPESPYEVRGQFKFLAPEKPDNVREQIVARGYFDKTGRVQYMLGLIEDLSEEEEPKPSPVRFYLLDDKFKLVHETRYDGEKAALPYDTSGMQVQWMTMKERKVPVWIGFGKDPYRKRSLRDLWEDPEEYESPDIRLYYLDEEGAIQALEKHEEYRIVDVLRPTLAEMQEGRVPIILARNKGTDLKFSYLFDFARAEVIGGKIVNFRRLSFFENGIAYRNLLDTRVDSVLSLDGSSDAFSGTFWFSGERLREQRVSLLLSSSDRFEDYRMQALRGKVDAALWVRSVYLGEGRVSAFALTNSEVQYHDFTQGRAALYSLDRYTFYQDVLTTNLQFPLVVHDRRSKLQLPALYTTEGSRFNRGTKVTIPHYDENGRLVELTAPARFRFQTGIGCRPLDTPIRIEGKPHFDYFCGDRFLRVPLEY